MHTIALTFKAFNEVTLNEIIARYGVYVLWTPAASRCPTYVGEGKFLGRIGQHVLRFGENVDGLFAPIDGPPGASKHDGHVAEAALILAAGLVGRAPRHNRNAGRHSRLVELGASHGVLRLTIAGRDPLQRPSSSVSRLASPKIVQVDFRALERDGAEPEDWLRLPWHRV
jgi:hypothetical protein